MITISELFELARHIQEQINKSYGPIPKHQKLFENITKNLEQIFEQYQQQPNLVRKAINLSVIFGDLTPQNIQLIRTSELLANRFSEWHSIIGKINYPTILGATVPEEIYASLDGLTYELEGRIDTSSDLSATFTVGSNTQSKIDSLTWNELLMILLMVLSIILPNYTNHMNNVQQDIFNKELMSELRHQTDLQEQILETEKERSMIDQERATKQKDLEDKFDFLMKSIEPLIPEHPSVPEVDQ